MSSISQIERSSSQTRMLATCTPSRRCSCQRQFEGSIPDFGIFPLIWCRLVGIEPMETQDERGSLPRFGSSPNLALMRLDDLIHDGQPEAGAPLEIGLERFKDLFNLLGGHAGTGVDERYLPLVFKGFEGRCERTSVFHGANGIFAKVPEDLF